MRFICTRGTLTMDMEDLSGYTDFEGKDYHTGYVCQNDRQNDSNCEEPGASTNITNSTCLLRDKKRQTTLTLTWLEDNYCVSPGVCLPRCVLYSHYLDFCSLEGFKPTCAATFGKVIRHKFPGLTTRRLGTRGHSKYHYYGLGIRETSPYFRVVYSGRGFTRFSGCKFTNEDGFTRKYCLSSKAGTIFLDFPKAENIVLPATAPYEQVVELLGVYKEHCQRILDAIISNEFHQVQAIMGQFWSSLPLSLAPLLQIAAVAYTIVMSDVMLHTSLIEVLIPATMEEMSESLLNDIRTVSAHWVHWEAGVITDTPALLQDLKGQTARRFCRALYRHISFLQVAQTARPILYDVGTVRQMLVDTEALDVTDSADIKSDTTAEGVGLPQQVLREMRDLLRTEGTVEGFIDWVDAIMEEKVFKPCESDHVGFHDIAQAFLLNWSYFGARLLRALTLNKAESFASFHVLRLLLEEYALLVVESRLHKEAESSLKSRWLNHTHQGESQGDAVRYPGMLDTRALAPSMDGNHLFHPTLSMDQIMNRGVEENVEQQRRPDYCIAETSVVPILTPPMSPCHHQPSEFSSQYMSQPHDVTVSHGNYASPPQWTSRGQVISQPMAEFEVTIQQRLTSVPGLDATHISGHWYPGSDVKGLHDQNNVTSCAMANSPDFQAQHMFPGYPTFPHPYAHVEGRDPLNLLDTSFTIGSGCGDSNEFNQYSTASGNRQTIYVEADINARMRVTCSRPRMVNGPDCVITLP